MTVFDSGSPTGEKRPHSGQPHNIFLNAGTLIDRPPVLFRVPSVCSAADRGAPLPVPSAPEPKAEQAPEPMPAPAPQLAARAPSAAIASPPAAAAPSAPAAAAPSAPAAVAPTEPLRAAPETIPTGLGDPDKSSDSEKPTDRTSKSRPAPSAPAPPAPSGRAWMEVIGSRLVILLLIAAIASIAFLANRNSTPASSTALAVIEMESLDSDLVSRPPSKAKPAAAKETEGPSAIKPAEPTFDLAELSSRTARSTSEPARESQVAADPVQANAGKESTTVNTKDQASANPPSLGSGSQGPSQSPADWRQDLADAGKLVNQKSATPISQPLSPDEAISAAVDAALAADPVAAERRATDPPSAQLHRQGAPSYQTTNQPAGISDWSRYLPDNGGGAPLVPPTMMNPPGSSNPYEGQSFTYEPETPQLRTANRPLAEYPSSGPSFGSPEAQPQAAPLTGPRVNYSELYGPPSAQNGPGYGVPPGYAAPQATNAPLSRGEAARAAGQLGFGSRPEYGTPQSPGGSGGQYPTVQD